MLCKPLFESIYILEPFAALQASAEPPSNTIGRNIREIGLK